MRFKKIIRLFENHSVSVSGMKGTGKDVVFGNVIARRKYSYVSNMDYSKRKYYIPLDFKDVELNASYKDLINGVVPRYVSPYPLNTDIYISDCGVYFPSQFCSQLNKEYQDFPFYEALSRQLGEHRIHTNCQNLNRVWDKIREQSDIYISCQFCKFFFKKIVFMKVIIYDKYQSALDRVKPCRVRVPMFNKQARINAIIYKDQFYNNHGSVKSRFLLFLNKSKHDTYYFADLFKNGKVN